MIKGSKGSRIQGVKGSSEMRKFELNSKFRHWRFRIEHSEPRTTNSELLSRSKGFTLIEIIILIVMAGILLPVIVVPFVTGVRGSGKPEMVTKAMYLAHQRMEGLMKYDYQILNANSLTALTGWTGIDPNFPNYSQRWELVHLRDDFTIPVPDSNLGYIRIRVDVRDPGNDMYQVYSVVTDFP
jgi:type II secretory pathway pseudopilin PulG